MSKVELSDFQRKFLAQGTGQKLFTEVEFDQALAHEEEEGETCTALKDAAEAILNRIPSQRQ